MLTVVEKVLCLQHIDVFHNVPTVQLAYLAAIAQEVKFAEGEDIYCEHDPSDSLYQVLEGKVRLHKSGHEITVAGDRDGFGTWALFDDEPRLVTATTLTDTSLLCIDRDDFIDLLADHVQITEAVLKTMVGRLRSLADRVGTEPQRRQGN